MIQDLMHQKILDRCHEVEQWFRKKSEGVNFPFYSSFDIRDSGTKVTTVDANIFPAGFNNICRTDQESAVDLVKTYMNLHYPQNSKNVVLLTEEHTSNAFYWENVRTLENILREAGHGVHVAVPRQLPRPLDLESASGYKVKVFTAERDGGDVIVNGVKADLIISNNDFSDQHSDWVKGLTTPMNPPYQLGWYQRKKDRFFMEYNRLAEEFCHVIDVDPWLIQVKTELYDNFDLSEDDSRDKLAGRVDQFIEELQTVYAKRGITQKPFVFVKNNSGTYGMAVIQVHSGEDIRQLNSKARKKMKAAKGGRDVEQVIIQEGVPTQVTADGVTAEPTIYMIGCELAGGFLRSHSEKGPEDNLNSPGAVYKKLCVSDLSVNSEGCPMENVYGWVARLGFLSIAYEAKFYGVEFKDYIPGCSA